jgi:hypothetical protein
MQTWAVEYYCGCSAYRFRSFCCLQCVLTAKAHRRTLSPDIPKETIVDIILVLILLLLVFGGGGGLYWGLGAGWGIGPIGLIILVVAVALLLNGYRGRQL